MRPIPSKTEPVAPPVKTPKPLVTKGDGVILLLTVATGLGINHVIATVMHARRAPQATTQQTPTAASHPGGTSSLSPIRRSQIAPIELPPGSEEVREPGAVTDAARRLKAMGNRIAPSTVLERVEVVDWRDAKYQFQTDRLADQVEDALRGAGYLYQETATHIQGTTKIHEFLAVSTKAKKIVPGFWLNTGEFCLLGWASFRPINHNPPHTPTKLAK